MTPIEVVEPQAAHVDALRQIYLSATSAAPHCRFAPDAERFAECLLRPRLIPTQIFVAEERGAPQGFAALVRVRSNGVEQEAISALFFSHPAAGQALLDACEGRASGDLQAFPAEHGRCPIVGYNAGWDGLSDRIPGVAQLLAHNGYAPVYRELCLIRDLVGGVAEPGAPPAGVDVRESIGDEKQFVLRALIGEQEAGECHYVTLANLGGADAARTGYVWWLNVQPEARRRGIGRYLMLRTLDHLRRLGCESCWLTTGAENWPAQPLYLALDFEIVDCTASYQKRRQIADA
jgi:ribosomal protein S18 acetylase RimI-like enzyme